MSFTSRLIFPSLRIIHSFALIFFVPFCAYFHASKSAADPPTSSSSSSSSGYPSLLLNPFFSASSHQFTNFPFVVSGSLCHESLSSQNENIFTVSQRLLSREEEKKKQRCAQAVTVLCWLQVCNNNAPAVGHFQPNKQGDSHLTSALKKRNRLLISLYFIKAYWFLWFMLSSFSVLSLLASLHYQPDNLQFCPP